MEVGTQLFELFYDSTMLQIFQPFGFSRVRVALFNKKEAEKFGHLIHLMWTKRSMLERTFKNISLNQRQLLKNFTPIVQGRAKHQVSIIMVFKACKIQNKKGQA